MNEIWTKDEIEKVANEFNRENTTYRIVAPIVTRIFDEKGIKGIHEFAEEVSSYIGKRVSPHTLSNYCWIYRKINHLIPEGKDVHGIPLNTLQKIASIKYEKNRKKAIEKAIEER